MKKLILAAAALALMLAMLCPLTAAAAEKDSERFPVDEAIQENLVFNVDFSTGKGDDLCGGTLSKNSIVIENDSELGAKVGVCGEYYNRYLVTSGLIEAAPLNEFAYEAYVFLSSDQTPWSHIISSRNEMFDMSDYAGWKGPLAEDPTIGMGMRLGNQYIFVPSDEMAQYYDQWIHVVIQGEFGEGFIFINGELLASGTYDIATSSAKSLAGVDQANGEIFVGGLDTATTGALGTDSGSSMDTVEGKIAYVRLYKTYLEDAQITALYNTAKSGVLNTEGPSATVAPTATPTAAPTATPTAAPTVAPTVAPTATPAPKDTTPTGTIVTIIIIVVVVVAAAAAAIILLKKKNKDVTK